MASFTPPNNSCLFVHCFLEEAPSVGTHEMSLKCHEHGKCTKIAVTCSTLCKRKTRTSLFFPVVSMTEVLLITRKWFQGMKRGLISWFATFRVATLMMTSSKTLRWTTKLGLITWLYQQTAGNPKRTTKHTVSSISDTSYSCTISCKTRKTTTGPSTSQARWSTSSLEKNNQF